MTHARSPIAGDIVAVESEHAETLLFTREEAADLAEVLKQVSGTASAPRSACDLAGVVRRSMENQGFSVRTLSKITGISRYRLGLLFSGKRAMTQEELKAISNRHAV